MEELPDIWEIDLEKVESAVLRRLVEEARNELLKPTQIYDRAHQRHNRTTAPYNRVHNRHNRG